MQKFINLTPHDVQLVSETGTVRFKESGVVARVDITRKRNVEPYEVSEGIELGVMIETVSIKTEVLNLPEPQEGVTYIVSSYVAQAVKRPDVVCPLTDATAIRDEKNTVIGVRGLQRYI